MGSTLTPNNPEHPSLEIFGVIPAWSYIYIEATSILELEQFEAIPENGSEKAPQFLRYNKTTLRSYLS